MWAQNIQFLLSFYNHGGKSWHTLSDLGEKVIPVPTCNVDQNHVRSHADPSQH